MSSHTTPDGIPRDLALELPHFPHAFALYADCHPPASIGLLLDAMDVQPVSLAQYVRYILNQASRPWCWAFAATQVYMVQAAIQGKPCPLLDPCVAPYVTHEHGGNSIDAALIKVQAVYGTPSASVTGNDPVKGTPLIARLPAAWKDDAAKHLVPALHWLRVTSLADCITALANAHPIAIGTNMWGGGHAVPVLEASPSPSGNQVLLSGPNSWGADWANDKWSYPGRPGWWQAPAEAVADAWTNSGYGAYALAGAREI